MRKLIYWVFGVGYKNKLNENLKKYEEKGR